MANAITGFKVGMKVEGTLGANGDKVEGKITKVNSKGKAVVDVEGRGKCIIPLHSLKKLSGKKAAKKAPAERKRADEQAKARAAKKKKK